MQKPISIGSNRPDTEQIQRRKCEYHSLGQEQANQRLAMLNVHSYKP